MGNPYAVLLFAFLPGLFGEEGIDLKVEKKYTKPVKLYQHMLPEKHTWYISKGADKIKDCEGGPYKNWYSPYSTGCNLPGGHYTVTCCDTRSDDTMRGWAQGFIEIDGKKYCNKKFVFTNSRGECHHEVMDVVPVPTPAPTPKPTPPPPAKPVTCKKVGGGVLTAKCRKWWDKSKDYSGSERSIFFRGDYLAIGLNRYGHFGSWNNCNSGTCGSTGDWGIRRPLGLMEDTDGWKIGATPGTDDFFVPGSPYQMFCIGWQAPSRRKYCHNRQSNSASYHPMGDPIEKTDTSSYDDRMFILEYKFQTPKTSGERMEVTVKYSLHSCSKKIQVDAWLKNTGDKGLKDVHFLIGLDPDQEAWSKSDYVTTNTIKGQRRTGSAYTAVCAAGRKTNVAICLTTKHPKSKAWHTLSFSKDPIYDRSPSPPATGSKITADSAIALGVHLDGGAVLGVGDTTGNLGMFLGLGMEDDVKLPEHVICT